MKPICTTNFYENSFNHEILAVAFEDGRAVATIRNLEISKLTGGEALEILPGERLWKLLEMDGLYQCFAQTALTIF